MTGLAAFYLYSGLASSLQLPQLNGSQWLMAAECLQQVWGIWQDARVDYLAETQLSCNCTSLGAEPVTSDAAGYVRYMYVYVPWCK